MVGRNAGMRGSFVFVLVFIVVLDGNGGGGGGSQSIYACPAYVNESYRSNPVCPPGFGTKPFSSNSSIQILRTIVGCTTGVCWSKWKLLTNTTGIGRTSFTDPNDPKTR